MGNQRKRREESNNGSKSEEKVTIESKKMKMNNNGGKVMNSCIDRKHSGHTSSEVFTSSSSGVSDCGDLLREILSRLPVESLMRFKCVSKYWQFLISQDQDLIDLHFTRSKQHSPDLFIVVPHQSSRYRYQQSFLIANLIERPFSNCTVRKLQQKPFDYTDILPPVNGLICFINRRTASVCILNPCTREVTPWIASSLRENKNYNIIAEIDLGLWLPTYFFGFDPATKQHKVMYTWTVREDTDFSEIATFGDDIQRTHICQVLTVGENTWRSIDAKVPFSYDVQDSVYSNGFIYWGDTSVGIPEYLNAFDVGREEFKVIKVPEEIRYKCENPPGGHAGPFHSLIEVGGHIALLQRWTQKVVKLYICEDDNTSSYSKWNEVAIRIPFDWGGVNGRFPYFHGVAGEDRIIIESYPTMNKSETKKVDLYYYDWKKKKTEKVFTWGAAGDLFSGLKFVSLFRSFDQSIWPVRHQSSHN